MYIIKITFGGFGAGGFTGDFFCLRITVLVVPCDAFGEEFSICTKFNKNGKRNLV